MSEKNTVQVLIGGKIMRLSGYESEEYLEKVASYLNHKCGELEALPGWRRMAQDSKGTLLALNALEEELQQKDKEMYDLKQDLVNLQIEMEKMKSGRN